MAVTRRNARLAAIVIGTGVAGALASAAVAGSQGGSPSHEQLHRQSVDRFHDTCTGV